MSVIAPLNMNQISDIGENLKYESNIRHRRNSVGVVEVRSLSLAPIYVVSSALNEIYDLQKKSVWQQKVSI